MAVVDSKSTRWRYDSYTIAIRSLRSLYDCYSTMKNVAKCGKSDVNTHFRRKQTRGQRWILLPKKTKKSCKRAAKRGRKVAKVVLPDAEEHQEQGDVHFEGNRRLSDPEKAVSSPSPPPANHEGRAPDQLDVSPATDLIQDDAAAEPDHATSSSSYSQPPPVNQEGNASTSSHTATGEATLPPPSSSNVAKSLSHDLFSVAM
jgi:hypothetical protein